MNIPEALSVATKAIELIKALRDVDHRISEAELKARLAELLSSAADLKMTLTEANEDIRARDREIERLKGAFAFQAETVKRRGMVYEKLKSGEPVGLPFCPRCLEVDGRYIKLVHLATAGRPAKCPQCKSDYDHQTEWLDPEEG